MSNERLVNKLDGQVADLVNKMDSFKRERLIKLYTCGILTRSEVRQAMGLPDSNPSEIQLNSAKIQTAKQLRNRYDYLCRKLNENKPFSIRDAEDYQALKQVFNV